MLYRISVRYFGLPIGEYVRKVRVAQAKELLEKGLPVTKVALMVGFLDYSYFAKVFKKEIGVLPMKIKQSHKRKSIED